MKNSKWCFITLDDLTLDTSGLADPGGSGPVDSFGNAANGSWWTPYTDAATKVLQDTASVISAGRTVQSSLNASPGKQVTPSTTKSNFPAALSKISVMGWVLIGAAVIGLVWLISRKKKIF